MTRRDTLQCVHEPFGDAFYYGPERLSERYENDVQARIDSGFSQSTFQTVLDRLEKDGAEVRLPILDALALLCNPVASGFLSFEASLSCKCDFLQYLLAAM